MRLFFAVDMPILPPWDPERNADAPGPAAAPAHLTLRFLGERPESMVAALERAGAEASAGVRSFAVDLRTIGAFPSNRSPRIVWLGVRTGREELVTLERRLSDALTPLGIPAEARAFVPHVTWRRIRSRNDLVRARRWLEEGELRAPVEGRIGALLLKESELSESGARHRTLGTFPLAEEPLADQDGSRPTSS
jgi:2'-5' RNA ligase